MPFSKTVTGKLFEYSGDLATGITVFFKSPYKMKISPEVVCIIRDEITKRSPVLMGANRDPLVRDSVGETLWLKHKQSPQTMSYVLPLLIQEGFCRINKRKPFTIWTASTYRAAPE